MKTVFLLLLSFASSLALAAEVIVNCSVSPCTIIHEINLPPFQLSPADGALIAGAVLAVWALGFGIRSIIRALNSDSVHPSGDI